MPVEVVPTLAPITRAAAGPIPISPPAAAVRAMATAALDDCIAVVIAIPTAIKTTEEKIDKSP